MYYSNRAAALTSLKRFGEAVRDAKQVVKLKPRWAKGYVRLGAAHFGLEEYAEVGGRLGGGGGREGWCPGFWPVWWHTVGQGACLPVVFTGYGMCADCEVVRLAVCTWAQGRRG